MLLSPLKNQVAGHDGVLTMGDNDEIIVKPCLPVELAFYEEAALHPELQVWMPTFYGSLTLAKDQSQQQQQQLLADASDNTAAKAEATTTTTTTTTTGTPIVKAMNGISLPGFKPPAGSAASNTLVGTLEEIKGSKGGEDECICLENLSHGFTRPCVLDLKLGVQLFDDDASEEKKQRLGAASLKTTSAKHGIRLTGFQVFNADKGEFTKYPKEYGKALTSDTILDGFRHYFAATIGPKRLRLVIERFVQDLEGFLNAIESLELRMRSSSILFVYEGDAEAFDDALIKEQEAKKRYENEQEDDDDEEEEEEEEDSSKDVKVTEFRLIDFAHSKWTPGQGPDEGVVLGVNSALTFFKALLEEY